MQPAAGRATHANFGGVPLTHALVIVAGIEDGSVAWGRDSVDLHVTIDGQPEDTLVIPNLPGLHLLSVETAARAGAGHEVSLELTTKERLPRWVCVGGWVLGSTATTR